MAKTVFTDGNPSQGIVGTIVDAAFLNSIFSHRHDGLNQDGSAPVAFATDTGIANAYAIAPSPALTQYVTGMPFTFLAANTNTGASALNINGLGAKTIKKHGSSDLRAGDIQTGQLVTVAFDGTYFQMMSQEGNAFTQSVGTNGWVKLPNGLILQWGFAGSSSSGTTVAFPIAFPNACLQVVMTDSGPAGYSFGAGNFTTTSFTAWCPSAGNGRWLAIGW